MKKKNVCVCDWVSLPYSRKLTEHCKPTIMEKIKLITKFKKKCGVPVVAQWLTNPTRNHEVEGSIPALTQWVNDPALP